MLKEIFQNPKAIFWAIIIHILIIVVMILSFNFSEKTEQGLSTATPISLVSTHAGLDQPTPIIDDLVTPSDNKNLPKPATNAQNQPDTSSEPLEIIPPIPAIQVLTAQPRQLQQTNEEQEQLAEQHKAEEKKRIEQKQRAEQAAAKTRQEENKQQADKEKAEAQQAKQKQESAAQRKAEQHKAEEKERKRAEAKKEKARQTANAERRRIATAKKKAEEKKRQLADAKAEKERAKKAEQRKVEKVREAEEAKKLAAKKKAEEERKAIAKQKAAEEARKVADAKKAAAAEEKKQQEKKRAEATKAAEAQKRAAAEEKRRAAAAGQKADATRIKRGKNLWASRVVAHMNRCWTRPAQISGGWSASVNLKISRSFYIRRATIRYCDASEEFCQSVTRAIDRCYDRRLPTPPKPEYFDPEINMKFKK